MRLRMGVLTISLCLALTACSGGAGISPAEQLALDIRGELLETSGCTAQLELTADYGQRVYTYGIDLSWQREGETVLTITAPENVAGITARILEGESALEYDGMRVETGPLDGSGMSPVDAVPVLLDYAEGGYKKKTPKEAWGRDFIYVCPGEHGDYDIISYGADGQENGEGSAADITNWE